MQPFWLSATYCTSRQNVPTITTCLMIANVFNPDMFASVQCQQHKLRILLLDHPKVTFSNPSFIVGVQLRNIMKETRLILSFFTLPPNTDLNQLFKIPPILKQIFKKCSCK